MRVQSELNRIVLGPEHNGIRLTPGEFDAITEYDDSFRYELIEGVLVVNPVASPGERGRNDLLGHWLWAYRESHPHGRLLYETLTEEYIRTAHSRRRADRVIWTGLGRQPDRAADIPSIAVEFVFHPGVAVGIVITSTNATKTWPQASWNTGSSIVSRGR